MVSPRQAEPRQTVGASISRAARERVVPRPVVARRPGALLVVGMSLGPVTERPNIRHMRRRTAPTPGLARFFAATDIRASRTAERLATAKWEMSLEP
jgi:hypothetical protein